MNKFKLFVALLFSAVSASHAAPPIYADGDLAPLGAPDGLINSADYLIANRIVLGSLTSTQLELSHGDVYPPGAPDEVINIQDLLLIQKLVLEPGANNYVENLDLFTDGPATVTVGNSSTTLNVGGFTGPGVTVVNNPNFADSDDSNNTVWNVSVSGGTGNVFLGTANLSTDPILDSGFDFSGMGDGQLVFDIKVNGIDVGTTLTAKIDSGYPNLGQFALTPSHYTLGSWRRVTISFADLLANPGPGAGLDLNNVINAFVMEVTGGSADFYLDNIFVSHACPEAGGCNATINTKATYSLVWSDEFDGATLNSDNWLMETGYGGSGWGNDEWQLYTNSTDNVSVSGGNLEINARCANPPACGKRNGTITSARINTLNKFSFKYGKVEARLKPPVGKSAWPAFWMLGKNFPSVGWPNSGEIDVMEIHNLFSNKFTTHFTVHYCDDNISSPCAFDPGWQYISNYLRLATSLGDDFHVFAAEWDENGITGKIDGVPYFYQAINPANMEEFLEEFFMILNIAIGGTLGGAPDASTPWPQTMLVDYVRVYQEDGGNGTHTIGTGPVTPESGLYSESHTESTVIYSNIINGADFGGNVTNTNEASTAVTPYDGTYVLQADYLNTGKFYGGFIFNFNIGQDISSYQTLKFAIDSSQMTSYANLEVKPEDGDAGPETGVLLSNYTPTILGNWAVYEIPIVDFGNFDPTNMNLLGFWNPKTTGGQLTFGTLYFDDIHFAGGM